MQGFPLLVLLGKNKRSVGWSLMGQGCRAAKQVSSPQLCPKGVRQKHRRHHQDPGGSDKVLRAGNGCGLLAAAQNSPMAS